MLGNTMKQALQEDASRLLGVPVRVAGLSVSPFSGKLEITGFSVANPPGFREPEALRIAKLTAQMSLTAPLDLGEVLAEGVTVNLELGRSGSNLASLKRGMGGSGRVPKLTIERLVMRQAAVQGTLFGRSASFILPEFALERVDLAGLVGGLVSAALVEARRRFSRVRAMPRGKRKPEKKAR